MKYAILGPEKLVLRISSDIPTNISPKNSVAQITDAQANTIKNGQENTVRIRYFYIENQLITYDEFQQLKKEAIVPYSISMAQLRQQLLIDGLLDDVNLIIANLPEPDKSVIDIWWEYATDIYRDNTKVLSIASLLNLTTEQIDDIFKKASKL